MNFKNIFLKVCPFLLLLIFVSICYFSQNEKSVTVDEFCHYPSGVYNLLTADLSMDCESPPLIKCLTALTSLITQPFMNLLEVKKLNLSAWSLGYQFMYNNFMNYRNIYKWGRIAVILLGCLLGWFIYRFGRSLFGEAGGIFALFLYVFNPNIIANSSLTTIDIGASCFIFLSVYGFWRYLKIRNLSAAILAGLLLGLAQLSKFTALLLYPIFFVIMATLTMNRFLRSYIECEHSSFIKDIGHFLLMLFVSLLVINAGYLFSGTFNQLTDFHFTSTLLKNISLKLGRDFLVPLPCDYVTGFDNQLSLSEGGVYISYLMGQHSLNGWWYYYIVAFVIKNPPSLLAILLLTMFFWKKASGIKLIDSLCIWVPMVMYLIYFSFFTHIPIGIRYILPIFPLIFLAAGSLVHNFKSKKWKTVTFIIAVAYIVPAIFVYPNYLSYFNVIAGGSKNGHKWLIDSNLDWGQDLPALKKYMIKNDIDEIKLGYFGRVDPHIYGIKYSLPNRDLEPGIYAISINYLVGYPYDMLKPNPKELINADLNYFEKYRSLKPVDILNNSIYIFKVSN
jgi:hypothetical protein